MNKRENKALRKKPGIGKLRSFFIDLRVFGLPLPKKYDEPDPGSAAASKSAARPAFSARSRRLAVALACVLVLVLGAGFWKLVLVPSSAQADPMDVNKLMKTYAHEISIGTISIAGTDETKVTVELDATVPMETGQKVLPELHLPKNVPEGYVYQGMRIVYLLDGGYELKCTFEKEGKKLLFQQEFFGEETGSLVKVGFSQEKELENGILYSGKDFLTQVNQVMLERRDGTYFTVIGELEKEKLEKLLMDFQK